MIERIIENWLIKASEKSYQIPFSYLLMKQGYTIIHVTRHCALEYGKDIIAIDKNGTPCAFQLKGVDGGKLKLKDWQQIIGQMQQLAFTPLSHPSLRTTEHHKSFLVVNGQIEEEVFNEINIHNTKWEMAGRPEFKIYTIAKDEILKWAYESKEDFLPSELTDFKLFLEFYTKDGRGFLDKFAFFSLLNSILPNTSVNKNEASRLISSCALLCSISISSHEEQKNHYALIEAWVIYIASIALFIEKNSLNIKYNDELELAEVAILNSLVDLYEEVSNKDNFFENDFSQDVFVYKNRSLIILGLLGYLGIRLILKPDEDIHVNSAELELLLLKLEPQINLWGESGVPFLLNTYWFYKILNKNEKAYKILASTILSILDVSKKNVPFPNSYYSAEEALLMGYDTENKEQGNILSSRNSFVLEALIHLATKEELKEFLQISWKEISKCFFEEFQSNNPVDLYKWRVREGVEVTKTPEATKKWSDLKNESLIYDKSFVPKLLKEKPYLAPLFIIVYPHRTNRNITLFFEEEISNL